MFDITQKRVAETADIELVDGGGAPLLDDAGEALSVTVHGPGSKVWEQADAERNRKRTARIEKNRGKLSAALTGAQDDEIDFLVRVTVSFNGWTYPCPEGEWPTRADMFRACYADPTLGFIRDHVHKEANEWRAFTKGSPKP